MSSAIVNSMQGPLCGTLASMLLYGVICMQTFQYAMHYGASDRHLIKWLIAFIWILESLHTALSIHFVEYYLIFHFNDPKALGHIVWSISATYIVGFVVAMAVNLFFVWRIWQLSKRALISIPIAVLVVGRTGVAIMNASYGFVYPAVPVFLVKVYPSMVAGWILSAIVDTLIAVTICYYLRKQRGGMRRTDHIINTLLMYTINTGALTSLFAILVIISFLVLPGRDFTAFVSVESKLYAVSILASLNGRERTLNGARAAVTTTNNVSLTLLREHGGKCDAFPTRSIEIRKDVEEDASYV